jgi:UDP-galactopyranose mutase
MTYTPFDCFVVGAGICGLSAARYLANSDKRVLVFERSSNIGGLCAEDYWNNTRYSKYGPHILHTDDKEVWQFLSNFTSWNYDVLNYVRAYDCGKLWTIPIDYEEVPDTLNNRSILYNVLYNHYSKKMWGAYANEVMELALKRLDHKKISWDKRYFGDKYQGFPSEGYNQMFAHMLDHPRISVLTNSEYVPGKDGDTPVIYTGRIDQLLGCDDLPFKKVGFKYQYGEELVWSDKYPVINFPRDYDFIRVHSSKMLYKQKVEKDVICYEYPDMLYGAECYPIVTKRHKMIQKSLEGELGAKYPFIKPAGRAGKYEYMNMDKAVKSGLEAARWALNYLE